MNDTINDAVDSVPVELTPEQVEKLLADLHNNGVDTDGEDKYVRYSEEVAVEPTLN